MNLPTVLTVRLLYDLPYWILYDYAVHVQDLLNRKSSRLRIEIGEYPSKALDVYRIAHGIDVLHFLAPQPFYRWCDFLPVPSVATVNHVANQAGWIDFHKYHVEAAAICTTSNLWYERLASARNTDEPALFLHPLGLDCDLFRPTSGARRSLIQQFGWNDGDVILGFSAKKTSDTGGRKGIDRLWNLMRCLDEKYPERIRLILFGPDAKRFQDGWDEHSIPQDLKKNVVVAGFVEKTKLPMYYSGLDFYICLSRAEGGPYPVMECMACGVITISTSVGIVPELIVEQENGFLVDEDNYLSKIPIVIDACAADLLLAENIRRRARESVIAKHAWESVVSAERYEEIYSYAIESWSKRSVLARTKPHALLAFKAGTEIIKKMLLPIP